MKADTELLTKNGWKKAKDLVVGEDYVLALNPDSNEIIHSKLSWKSVSNYSGEMFRFSGKQRGLDLTVSSEDLLPCYNIETHDLKMKRVIVLKSRDGFPYSGFNYTGKKNDFFVLPEITVPFGRYQKLKAFHEKKIPMKAWLEFFGFWLADGCVRGTQGGRTTPSVEIKQNVKNEAYVLQLFEKIGYPKPYIVRRKDGNNSYCVSDKQLWTYLFQFGNSLTKFIPFEFLELDKPYLESLFNGYINGDSYKKNRSLVISTISKRLADNLQELILKLYGQIVQFNPIIQRGNRKPLYKCYFVPERASRFHKYRSAKKEIIHYTGQICKITTEDSYIVLTRQDGSTIWSGNRFFL